MDAACIAQSAQAATPISNPLGDCIGFVRLVDTMPQANGDAAIVQAARVSYGSGTKSVSDDAALVRYLMRHRHTTPFEMVELKFHVACPLFVARQWLRHRTASVNEYSARYSILDDKFYVPPASVVQGQSQANKQGRAGPLPDAAVQHFRGSLDVTCHEAYGRYQAAIEAGVARELARLLLPVNIYTQFYWKIDLHNLFHFLELRLDAHAQYEIRQYAEEMLRLIEPLVPVATRAFRDYRLQAVQLSAAEVATLQGVLPPMAPPLQSSSKSEASEWQQKWERLAPRPSTITHQNE